MRPINIMLVDDHTLLRKGLKMILEKEKMIKVSDEAKDGMEAIDKALINRVDIIIMDINMPILNGIDTLKRMKDLGISSKIIILTADPRKELIISATKFGAKGYLLKDCEPNNLIKAVQEVYAGRSYIDPSVSNILSYKGEVDDSSYEDINNKITELSKREYEVLIKLAEGLDNKAIGNELYISEKTVKNHITKIFKKLQVNDRVQAALFAYTNNIK